MTPHAQQSSLLLAGKICTGEEICSETKTRAVGPLLVERRVRWGDESGFWIASFPEGSWGCVCVGGKRGSHTPHKDPRACPDQASGPAAPRWGWQGGRAAGPAAGTWWGERDGDGRAGTGSVRGDIGEKGPGVATGGRARGGERKMGQGDAATWRWSPPSPPAPACSRRRACSPWTWGGGRSTGC